MGLVARDDGWRISDALWERSIYRHYARIVLVNLRICRWAITRYSSASRRDATAYGKSA
jgi:hypothetical protein